MEYIKIRDSRNGDWYWVNNAVLACTHISTVDKCVYSALCTFSGFQEIRPTFEQLAEKSNLNIRTCKRSIKNLTESGLVEIVVGGGRGKANLYSLPKALKGCQNCTLSKGCQKVSERVTEIVIKGDTTAPHKDIYKDIKKDTETKVSDSPLIEKAIPDLDGDIKEEVSRGKKESKSKIYDELCKATEKRRGFPFVNLKKQYYHLSKAFKVGITQQQLQQRWKEFENKEGYDEFITDNGFDWGGVVSSFDRKK